MCEIKRVGALRGRQVQDCRGWIMKICAKLKRVGALRGRRRVDCEKMREIKRVGALSGRRRGGLRKNVQN